MDSFSYYPTGGGNVVFKWESETDGTLYDLYLKKKDTLSEYHFQSNTNSIALGPKDGIRIGCTYDICVKVSDNGTPRVLCEEQDFLLGGYRVPRNVEAAKNKRNPVRWVDVSFGKPQLGRISQYVVVAMPVAERGAVSRRQITSNDFITMKHLKSDTKYLISVTAEYEGDDQEGECTSYSDYISTEKSGPSNESLNIFNIASSHKLKIDARNMKITLPDKEAPKSTGQYKNLGQVMNLRSFVVSEKAGSNMYKVQWDTPNFLGYGDDFFIQYFVVEAIVKGGKKHSSHQIQFTEARSSYTSDELEVFDGTELAVAVKTYFEEIDTEGKMLSRESSVDVKCDKQKRSMTEEFVGFTTSATIPECEEEFGQGYPCRKKYKNKQVLGQGGLGDVYLVEELRERKFMVRKISLTKLSIEGRTELNERLRCLRPLRHDRLLQIIDFQERGTHGFFYTEYMGMLQDNLEHLVQEVCGLGIDKSLFYAYQILDGLEALHRRGIVHGDVRCANVLWSTTAGLKLKGFEMGRRLEEELTKSSHSTSLNLTRFRSPEEITQGMKMAYDISNDVWSLGCTLVEMLTTKPPWQGVDDRQLFLLMKKDTFPIPKNLPELAKGFLQKIFVLKRDRPSALELKDQKVLDGDQKIEKEKFLEKAGIVRFRHEEKPDQELLQAPGSGNTVQTDQALHKPRNTLEYEGKEYLQNCKKIKELGCGSYGEVHSAVHGPTGRQLAIKIFWSNMKQSSEDTHFYREFAALMNLSHKNIVTLYGFTKSSWCERDDRYFLLMELMKETLEKEISRYDTGFPEDKTKDYTIQIMSGLQYMHKRDIIHRDVKGDNVLVDGKGLAKLCDFGYAKVLDRRLTDKRSATEERGTVFWRSPESSVGKKIGRRTDVWSLACTVIEMLTKKPPFWDEGRDHAKLQLSLGKDCDILRFIPNIMTKSGKEFLKRIFEPMDNVTERPLINELFSHPWIQGRVEMEAHA